MRKYIDIICEGSEEMNPNGYIVISKVVVDEKEYWNACFFKKRPLLQGMEYADQVLVQTIDRAGKSKETALATALKKKPGAEVIEAN